MQAWPWLWKIAKAEPLTAASILASSKTMFAPLPPSSSWTRFRFPAEACDDLAPGHGRSGEADLGDARMLGEILAGRVAVARHDIDHALGEADLAPPAPRRADVDSGVSSAGFSTIVLPAASAGPIFQLVNMSGKFHGTICPTTPTGTRMT